MRYLVLALLTCAGCDAGTTAPVEGPDVGGESTDTFEAVDTVGDDTVSSVDTLPAEVDECTPATADDDCDDGIPCTQDRCYGGTCINVPDNIACDDDDLCTYDSCDPQKITNGGCSNKPIGCDDGDPCTKDVCIPGQGCDHSQPNVDVCSSLVDDCHGAICIPGQGCEQEPISCEDGDLETVDMCVPDRGCTHQVVECGGTSFGDCAPSNPCMVPQCVAGKCQETAKDCDDGIACTDDSCDTNGVCQHVPNPAHCPNDALTCTVATCDVKYGCVQSWVQCDDENICTADSCAEGVGCQFNLIEGCCLNNGQCDDGNACTTDICSPLHRCEHTPLNPDDGIACTLDSCVQDGTSAHYYHNPKDNLCPEGLHCSADAGCVECTNSYDHCYDGDACTSDTCDWQTHTCRYDQHMCDDNQQCNPTNGWCEDVNTGCDTDWDCDDSDPCTQDFCKESGECGHVPDATCLRCDPEDPYDPITGDPQCISSSVCDGEEKWVQYTGDCSVQGTCEKYTTFCFDSQCETNACVEGIGCLGTSRCDDGDPCTNDYCASGTGECSYYPNQSQGCPQQ